MTWLLCGGRNDLWIEINSVFVPGHRNRLDIRMEIEIDLISVMGSKATCFLCDRSKLTWLLCVYRNRRFGAGGRNRFRCVRTDNRSGFVYGSRLTWF